MRNDEYDFGTINEPKCAVCDKLLTADDLELCRECWAEEQQLELEFELDGQT